MIEMKEIFKNLSSNKKNVVLIICAVMALVLLVVSGFSEEKETGEQFDVKLNVSSSEYIKEQEEKLKKLIEKIDGAGDFMIFLKFVLPLSLPGLATITLFTSVAYWNDWMLPLYYITDDDEPVNQVRKGGFGSTNA